MGANSIQAIRRVLVWNRFHELGNAAGQYRDVGLRNQAELALLLLQKPTPSH
jgi:hypothetical protein